MNKTGSFILKAFIGFFILYLFFVFGLADSLGIENKKITGTEVLEGSIFSIVLALVLTTIVGCIKAFVKATKKNWSQKED